MARTLHLFLGAVCTIILGTSLAALGPDTPASRFALTSWTEKDGLTPSIIYAIAQDKQGYLWLGTAGGLIRFDGVRFMRWNGVRGRAFPNPVVSALAAGPDGSLWIGFRGIGGVSRLKDGAITTFGTEHGLTDSAISALFVDRAGIVWAGSLRGLARFVKGRWEQLGPAQGFTDERIFEFLEDRAGRLWLAGSESVFRYDGRDRLEVIRKDVHARSFAEDADGTIWALTTEPQLVPLEGTGVARQFSKLGGRPTLIGLGPYLRRDRDDNFWITRSRAGILRVSARARRDGSVPVEGLSEDDGLSNNSVLSLFEDREGNVWIGTQRGLNKLSNSAIQTFPARADTFVGRPVRAIARAADTLWLGTEGGLYRLRGSTRERFGSAHGLPGEIISSLHVDRTGRLWLGTDNGLARHDGADRFTAVHVPGAAGGSIRSFTTDANGAFWFSNVTRGTFRWKPGETAAVFVTPKVALSALADSRGAVWLGFTDGTVERHFEGKVAAFSREHGLIGDRASTIHEDANGAIWVGTNGGLTRFVGEHPLTLTLDRDAPVDNVTAIAADENGHLWFSAGRGIIRLDVRNFEKMARDQAQPLSFNAYGANDGLPGTPNAIGYPAAARTGDGRLWFLTNNGIALVDPRVLQTGTAPLAATIEDAATSGRTMQPTAGLQLPPRTSNLQIDYTALSFTAPTQIHFRYRLDGFDTDWVDAGDRRRAFYTNLPPRGYRFQVQATSDGRWTSPAATWNFSISPAFYETAWFYIACALVFGVAVYSAWQFRAFRLRQRFALVLSERTRISRELHDTLLQSLVGVSMQIERVLRKLDSSPASARDQLERLERQMKFYIREARQSVWDLRSPILATGDLPMVLREVGERLTSDQPARFEFLLHGTPRPCATKTHEEQLLRISQEALSNAVRHAGATQIRLELHYAPAAVTVRVVDDGRGFDVGMSSSRLSTHWGLASMRERAQQVGADFRLISAPGEGTTVEVAAA